jgi:tRNA(Arg) A34 adenosine deaminase TadA
MGPDDERFMRMAVDASREALRAGNMPFGAVLVRDGAVIEVSTNEQRTGGDITAHAEVVLVRAATARSGLQALLGSTVYASGEPCAMCAAAMFWAGIRRVVFGATTPDIAAVLGGATLPIRCADVVRLASPHVTVDGPVLREEAVEVLRQAAERYR